MPALSRPFWQQLSASLAHTIVRLWPHETKQWGLAFEAELSEISTPLASFRWVLGGLMLLTRERWKSFFKSFGRPVGVPAGSPLESFIKNSNRAPRTPRIVTVLLLAGAGAILMHPDVRSCIRLTLRSIRSGYNEQAWEYNWQPSRWDSVKRLRKEALRNHDPKLLALLSLLSEDKNERLRLSDEAIRQDTSLTWIDYELWYGGHEGPGNRYSLVEFPSERITRLRNWDPDNAVPRELGAQLAAYRAGAGWGSIIWPDPAKNRGSRVEGSEDQPPPESKWLAAMDEVFTATKYDDYSTQQFELIRYANDMYGIRDPDIPFFVLANQRMPLLISLRSYSNWILSQSLRKEKKGDIAGAVADAKKALRFAQRMSLGQKTAIEFLVAGALGMKACERLQVLLERQGKADEASLVAFQLANWKAEVEHFASGIRGPGRPRAAEWAGITILSGTVLILITGLVSCISLLVLWLKRTSVDARGRFLVFLSWALDAAPVVLLGACAVVYLSFQPFAQTLNAYFSAQQPISDFEGLFVAGSVTHVLPRQLVAPALFWTIVTTALSLLAAFLLLRMFLRRLRHA